MSFPDSTALELLWDGDNGDTITRYTFSEGAANSYGEKLKTWSAGTATKGRFKILKANETSKEFGYLLPGDAISLLKNSYTVAQDDRLLFNGTYYQIIGIVAKKTHQEIACKRIV